MFQTTAAERVKLRRESSKSAKRPVIDADDVTTPIRKPKQPSYAKYKPRTKEEDMALLYLMWATGLDLEDMRVGYHFRFCTLFYFFTSFSLVRKWAKR